MDFATIALSVTAIAATLGFALVAGAFRYAVKNESRMSRLETKMDLVMRHLGLNKDVERLNGKQKSRLSP